MGTQTVTESEFSILQFEKQLINLKDSQEAINSCCKWCLENRVHHKKIVNAWLNVLKRVKVEQRLILFYLANDVVQYSKRRNYEYVESYGTALQKATTMVRDEKVKHKILRIFKIWEQRSVYNDEFISDLCGLLSVVPSGSKNDEPHEFQPNYVINKVKTCSKLETDTDLKLKTLKEHNPKMIIDDNLIGSLKDRAHLDDVEKEVEVYIKHMEEYINALKLEIKNRIGLIGVLKQAETQLDSDRKDVKVVANAYRMFGTRVKTFQRKLEEHKETLSSPIPSPDINAPSPSSDSDIDLPDDNVNSVVQQKENCATYNPKAELQLAAGYYNSTDKENSSNSFLTNGFSSFLGSDLSFNLENFDSSIFNTTALASVSQLESYTPPQPVAAQHTHPMPVEAPVLAQTTGYPYSTGEQHLPVLPPPPTPLFGKAEGEYNSQPGFELGYRTNNSTNLYDSVYPSPTIFDTGGIPSYSTASPPPGGPFDESFEPPAGANPYPPSNSEEYNPEEYTGEGSWEAEDQPEASSWGTAPSSREASTWGVPPPRAVSSELETPESPPMFEKEGYSDPIEYHDNVVDGGGAEDVDHRVLPGLGGDMEDSLGSLGAKDVDHRNLISLTGSPGNSEQVTAGAESAWTQVDQDYRLPQNCVTTPSGDQDYRINFNLDNLKLPPPPPPPKSNQDETAPPPPPPHSPVRLPDEPTVVNDDDDSDDSPPPQYHPKSKSPRKSDNIENIDMDLSDEDLESRASAKNNLRVLVDGSASSDQEQCSLEPPPPLPDLPDDVDANNFLDDLSNDLHEFSNLSDELNCAGAPASPAWNQPIPPPPVLNFSDMLGGPPPSLGAPPPPSLGAPPPPMPPLPMHLMPPPQPGGVWLGGEEEQHQQMGGMVEPWMGDKEGIPWAGDELGNEENYFPLTPTLIDMPLLQNNWMEPPLNPFGFRGRGGNNRGGGGGFLPNKRGRGRGGNFRGGARFQRGGNSWSRRNFRGVGFRGSF